MKIYDNISQWYFPEIDYWEMIEKFRWTKDVLRHNFEQEMIIETKNPDGSTNSIKTKKYISPRNHISLMFHSKAWEIDKETGKEKPSQQQIFQFWNKQFNDELTKILKKINPRLILEVGAGDGSLTKILFNRKFNIVATDSYDWPFRNRYFKVEELKYKEALKKYQPDVVIGSWMPLGTDWTPDFRKTKSVNHYIIIGEVNAACGGDWKKRKGWKMIYEKEATKYALCRTDDLWFEGNKLENSKRNKFMNDFLMHHSAVYRFSRYE